MSAFRALAAEAFRDAVRRRIVIVIAAVSLLSLLAVDSCTGCEFTVSNDGEIANLAALAGATGASLFLALGLWIVALAGILAADHLAETLADGSALLVLARPVSRDAFAAARLCGALGVALTAGAVLLGGTAALLHVRQGLPLAPALAGALACALGAFVVAALAMTASLYLPRAATTLAVLAGVAIVAVTNLLGPDGLGAGGEVSWLDLLAPPLATSMLAALDPWLGSGDVARPMGPLLLRLALWAVLATGLLRVAFRRLELRS